MPVVPKEALPKSNTFIKASKLQLEVGARRSFEITSPHESNKDMQSIKVRGDLGEGAFGLNKTNMAVLTETLGMDSDLWVGARFDAVVLQQKSPKTGELTKSFTIVKESIRKA